MGRTIGGEAFFNARGASRMRGQGRAITRVMYVSHRRFQVSLRFRDVPRVWENREGAYCEFKTSAT
jgi:hypothetical protein